MTPLLFSEQLVRRRERWRTRGLWRGVRHTFHRYQEVRAVRRRSDSDQVWRCCDNWQRTLTNKWNSREFAAKHEARLPTLYWSGLRVEDVPLESLPSHFVMRAVSGAARNGVIAVADGLDVLRGETVSPESLRDRFTRRHRVGPRVGLMVEEFVRSEDARHPLPLEYKCHAFSGVVAAVQVMSRSAAKHAKHRYYTPDWNAFPDLMGLAMPQDHVRPPPTCLDEMLKTASTLGQAFGSYVRVDFFTSDRGAVFNEFSVMPHDGRMFTPYCDRMFGDLWAAHCG